MRAPPKYERRPAGSVVDEVEPRIRELLRAIPTMPATVIAERIGWRYSIRTLSGRVARVAAVLSAAGSGVADGVCAGEIAQCDFWFPDIVLPVGFGQSPDGEAVAGVDDGDAGTRAGRRRCWSRPAARRTCMPAGGSSSPRLGAVPRVLVWDGEGAVGRWRRRPTGADRRVSGVPRHPGREGADLQAGATRRPRVWSSGSMTTWRPRSCPAASSPSRPISTPSCRAGWSRANQPAAPGAGLPPGRPDRRRPGRDAGVAAGAAGDRVAVLDAAAAGSLRAAGRQRLLGAPVGDRAAHRGHR